MLGFMGHFSLASFWKLECAGLLLSWLQFQLLIAIVLHLKNKSQIIINLRIIHNEIGMQIEMYLFFHKEI